MINKKFVKQKNFSYLTLIESNGNEIKTRDILYLLNLVLFYLLDFNNIYFRIRFEFYMCRQFIKGKTGFE